MSDEDNPTIARGFDRGVDFKDMKKKFIAEYEALCNCIDKLDENDRYYVSKRKKFMHRLIYCLIASIQLRNGSRIIESCTALPLFLDNDDLDEKVIVKIAKSKSIKYKKDTKEKYETKARYRKMIFPTKWITLQFVKDIKFYLQYIEKERLMKRVLDYLLKDFKCNTHSLRYSFINFMLYDQKKEMTLVAKFIGHSNTNQLVRYSQLKESDKIFDLDI
jgi:integrase